VYREGAVRQILVNAYERDRAAREACIAHFGPVGGVCGLRFEEKYGALVLARRPDDAKPESFAHAA
jgi:5-methylcytosine-specific restriction enzyme A